MSKSVTKTANTGTAAVKSNKIKKQSMWIQAFRRLSHDRVAMIGLIGILALILISIAAPLLTPYDYKYMDIMYVKSGPCFAHPFGTDSLGRDILSRLLYGGRYSLALGLISSVLSLIIGVIFGATSGYFGGVVDDVIMRICDVIQAIPSLLFCIIISMTLGTGYVVTIFAIALGGCTGNIRLMRSQLLTIRKEEYLDAASAINCSTPRILFRHALPNVMSPLLIGFTMGIGNQIQTAASLSVLGLGVQPPLPEWGAMLSDGLAFIYSYPHLIFFPGLMIFLISLFINLFGDGMRDALDPKLKR